MSRFMLPLLFGLILVGSLACDRSAHRPRTSPATTRAGQFSEDQKIEALIAVVAGMKDVTFIRNGSEYSASAAAQLMRYKWNRNSEKIATARDFVLVAGSKSNTTGREYRVKLKDGREMSSAEFLLGKLQEIERGR